MVKIISEIGINHNGSMELCKELIMLSKVAGADYVKIQKRNPDVCVPEKQKTKRRQTPWGEMSYLEYKYRMEFSEEQIKELVDYSNEVGIEFFASVWDCDSVDVMSKYTTIGKIGSASITDLNLCKYAREKFDFLIISTGMSTEDEIKKCVDVCNPDVIMHTNSTYPCPVEDLNLKYINWLEEKYPEKDFALLIGEDNLCTFHKWKNYQLILERHQLYVYPRVNVNEIPAEFKGHPKIKLVDAPRIELSSSDIRSAIKAGKNVRPSMPPESWQYLDEMNFYK